MAASTMAPMAMAMPPSDMMLEVKPIIFIGMKEISTAIGNGDDRNDGAGDVPEEDQDDQRHDDRSLR